MITNSCRPTVFRTLGGIILLSAVAVVGHAREDCLLVPAFSAESTIPDLHPLPPRAARSPAEMRAQQEIQRAKRETWAAQAKIAVAAVGNLGGIPVAVIEVEREPAVVKTGFEVAESIVTEIDVANAAVTLTARDHSQRVIPLTPPEHPVKLPTFSEDQVNRMVDAYLHSSGGTQLPLELMSVWRDLDHDSKLVILLSYLRNGTIIDVQPGPFGLSLMSGQLFEGKITARRLELRQTFLASLTPEQQQHFQGKPLPAIRIDAPPSHDVLAKWVAQGEKIQADQNAVVVQLTPEQRKLYDAWHPATPR